LELTKYTINIVVPSWNPNHGEISMNMWLVLNQNFSIYTKYPFWMFNKIEVNKSYL
jgi:hypothetical protein